MPNTLDTVFNNAASGMSAQSIRISTIASNLANSGSVGTTEDSTYHAKYPVFSEVTHKIAGLSEEDQPLGGVRVTEIKHGNKPLEKRYDPNNPAANAQGFVYLTDVNPIEQMTNMISASKDYEANAEVMNTTKSLINLSMDAIKYK
ncbi:MAG: flagellar basal body rod protein FlgC [Gammaproteobacteria bacterium]